MHRPDRLPTSEADLDEWSVYADALLAAGDPRGEALALELGLPAEPSDEQLAAFQAVAGRVPTRSKITALTWSLGHVAALEIGGRHQSAFASDAVRTVAQRLVEEPRFQLLQSFGIWSPVNDREWVLAIGRLPPTCTRVMTRSLGDIAFGVLPPTVSEIDLESLEGGRPGAFGPLLDGRAATIGLPWLRTGDVEVLADLLDRAPAVRLRMSAFDARLPGDRCILGRPGDAALVAPGRVEAVFPRWTAQRHQDGRGVLPVRMQLAARLPEHHTHHDGFSTLRLLRTGEAWVHRWSGEAPWLPLRDGDRLRFRDNEFTFVASAGGRSFAELARLAT